MNVLAIADGESLTSMCELYLSAVFDTDLFEGNDIIMQYITHPNLVFKATNKLETAWMNRNTISFFFKFLVNFESKVLVIPNLDCLVY